MRQAIEAHLGSRQLARVIYGAIIGMALVVSLEPYPPRPAVMVGTLLATAVAVGLAELYTAFTIARWSGLGLISFYGFVAGRLAGARRGASLLQALVVGVVGGALIAFKALIH
jgi:hypothetical protein